MTIYAMNLYKDTEVVMRSSYNETALYTYILEPGHGDLTSTLVTLNSRLLSLDGDRLPELPAAKTNTMRLQPLTFGFFVISSAAEAHCLDTQ